MNNKSISNAKDVVLRGSEAAIKRAAQKARKIAEETGTPLVVNRGGKTVLVDPSGLGPSGDNSANDDKAKSRFNSSRYLSSLKNLSEMPNIADQEHWRLTAHSGSAGKEGSSVCCMRLVRQHTARS